MTVRREEPIQRAVVDYLRAVLPADSIVHHARGELNQRGKRAMMEMAKAKRLGAVKGFPDLVVVVPGAVLFFEVKAEGGYPSADQRAVHNKLRRMGHHIAVVRGIDDTREALRAWNIITEEKDA